MSKTPFSAYTVNKLGKDRLTKKEVTQQAQLVFYRWFASVEVNMVDLGEVTESIKSAIRLREDLDVWMPKLVERYRVKS